MRANKKVDILNDRPKWVVALSYIIVTAAAIISMGPLLIIIMSSFATADSIKEYGYSLFVHEFTLSAWKYVFDNIEPILRSTLVSVGSVVVTVILSLFLNFQCGYVFSDPKFRWTKQFSIIIYATTIFSGGMVAGYLVKTQMYHLNDTFWILCLPTIGFFDIMLVKSYIQTTVSVSLIESARLDGAKELYTMFKIVMPLSLPVLALQALTISVGKWNDWNTPMLFITRRDYLVPLTLLLQRLETNANWLQDNASKMGNLANQVVSQNETVSVAAYRMAVAIISLLPIMIMYPFTQKYFITGITIGSVKE